MEAIFITQLIYIKEGMEDIFHQFEDKAIPIIGKYNGQLLLRSRPNKKEWIESNIDHPYEIHLVQFASNEDFELFLKDEERQQFLHMKEASIQSVVLIKGHKM
ncbi:MAG: DUF1330 domain-containing protein [Saprospiraceae bacterium]